MNRGIDEIADFYELLDSAEYWYQIKQFRDCNSRRVRDSEGASAPTGRRAQLCDLHKRAYGARPASTIDSLPMASNVLCILLSALAVSHAQVAVNGQFFGRYYAAAKPVLTPGYAQVAAPVFAPAAPVYAAPAPVFAAPAPAPPPAPVYAAPAPAMMAAPAPMLAAPVARPVYAAFAAPAVQAAPVLAAPPAPAPAYAAPAPMAPAPAFAPAAPFFAAQAYVPAYAPFLRTPYFIGSNKSKKD
ncbi:unnamed protein product [Cylicocyclus nassatus]|uniref:Uncharacterized protein n=1 Tax=Cylicocyclus nassatus TaxID=53992 RepID=A0AA36DPE3_CYLNA|nr:unnamed protein product [Cylicocyclus nassatus]